MNDFKGKEIHVYGPLRKPVPFYPYTICGVNHWLEYSNIYATSKITPNLLQLFDYKKKLELAPHLQGVILINCLKQKDSVLDHIPETSTSRINYRTSRDNNFRPTAGYLTAEYLLELGASYVYVYGMNCYRGFNKVKCHDMRREIPMWLALRRKFQERLAIKEPEMRRVLGLPD